MNTNKLDNVCGKGPLLKTRSGKFNVAIWQWKKTISAKGSLQDFFAERQQDVYRASIRFSKWNRQTRTWHDQTIWCSIDDLRSLVQALDELNIRDSEEPARENAQGLSPVPPSAIEG